MASGPITSWQKDGEKWKEWHLFSWAPKSLWTLTTAMKLKMLALQKKNYGKPWQHIKKKRRYFTKKVCIVKAIKAMVFPVFMYGCEICTIMNAEYWRIDAFELWCWRLLIVPWTAKRLNQSILKKSTQNIHWKDWCWSRRSNTLANRRDWGWEEKRTTEDEKFGWHHWLYEHEFEQTLGDIEGQGSMVCCCPWSRKESDMI